MRKNALAAMGILALTAASLCGLVVLNPFDKGLHLVTWLFHAGNEKALVHNLYKDPQTQEISCGDHPLAGLGTLASFWDRYPNREHIYFMGNSQMLSMVLSPDEPLPGSTPERTYPDLVFAHYKAELGDKALFYRIAVPNINYMEALWYLQYLLTVPELRPTRLVLQLNFQTFRILGIRDGMLEMLSNRSFHAAISSEARSGTPRASTFQTALDHYAKFAAEREQARTEAAGQSQSQAQAKATNTSQTGITESVGFGNLMESAVRNELAKVPGWSSLHAMRASFLDLLYRLRVFVLNIKPTTRRSIGGVALAANVSSLEQIAATCRRNGIVLILVNVPQNPSAPLYRTEQDRRAYEEVIRHISERYNLPLYDFETRIPREDWGVWIDGPDPIHMGREGHRRMAKVFIESGILNSLRN